MDLVELDKLEKEIINIRLETTASIRKCFSETWEANERNELLRAANEICLNSLRMIEGQKKNY